MTILESEWAFERVDQACGDYMTRTLSMKIAGSTLVPGEGFTRSCALGMI